MNIKNSSGVSDEDVALYNAYYETTGHKDRVIEALLFTLGEDETRRIVQDSAGKRIELVWKDGSEDRLSSINYVAS